MHRYNSISLKYVFFFSLFLNYCFANTSTNDLTNATTEDEVKVTETEDIDKPFNAVDMIMHHISDSNEWHLWTTTDENGEEHHVSIPLPIILFENGNLNFFMSSKIAHGQVYNGYTLNHGVLESTEGLQKATLVDLFKGLNGKFIDFSITKNVAGIFISIFLLLLIFISASKVYTRNNGVPKGIAGFVEPIILFIRDEVALPNIGQKNTPRFLPFLLTIFFFIWINNLMGLIPFFPGGTNVTGNIAVTMVLALITLIIVNVNGNAGYWGHIFRPPGVPLWLLPIMIPVEILGIVTKPFALMMRLFANITAGHIMILSLISLVFMFKTIAIAPASVALALFVSVLELLVAALQAYIFTVLTALFIGMAVHEEHH